MKYLFSLILILSAAAHAAEPLLGEDVKPSKAQEIISMFNSGVPLISNGVVVDTLPEGAGDHIHSIDLDDGKYVVQIDSFICTNSWHYVSWSCDIKTMKCAWVVDPEYKCRQI